MIDIETVSARSNAAILVVAAVKFSRTSKFDPQNCSKFYMKVDLDDCLAHGLHQDPDTMAWWGKQDPEIRKEAFEGTRHPLITVLQEFSHWFGTARCVWSHGATFDIPIMENAYKTVGLESPWKYQNCRDTRTVFELARVYSKDLPSNNKHHALYDCYRQIWGVQESLRRLRRK